jgi:hypothetical protein
MVKKPDPDAAVDSIRSSKLTDADKKERNQPFGSASSAANTAPTPPLDQKLRSPSDPTSTEAADSANQDISKERVTPLPIAPQADGVSGFNPDNTAGSNEPDVLGIDADARALARLMCLEGASPLAIAVLGGWGAGKSTFWKDSIDGFARRFVRKPLLRNPRTRERRASSSGLSKFDSMLGNLLTPIFGQALRRNFSTSFGLEVGTGRRMHVTPVLLSG